METSPPIKPPRGVKSVKETSGLLMSVIRTLSTSETNEQRDREKAKLETEFKICDRKLDDLVSSYEKDLINVMQLFGSTSQIVNDNRAKIASVKENLQDCKKKLHCRRDELKNLWLQGLEYKHMLQLLDEIEKMNEVPNKLSDHLAHKQYLHATKLLIEAVSLGKNTLEGVESLKELSQDLEQKKELLHVKLLSELNHQLYLKPSQQILTLRRQESGRDHLQRGELRLSGRKRLDMKKPEIQGDFNLPDIEEDLSTFNPDESSPQFMAVLVKCLMLLDKLPFALKEIQNEMGSSLLNVIHKTTQHVKDYSSQASSEGDPKSALKELVKTLFEQLTEISSAHTLFLKIVEKISRASRGSSARSYTIAFYWTEVQNVLEIFLNDYLDIQNMSSEAQEISSADINDMSSFFSRRKQPSKKKTLFKFDGSSSALTLNSTLKSANKAKEKVLICQPHPNNILVVFIPFISFIEEIEQNMNIQRATCQLYNFITLHVTDIYLKQKSGEVMDQIGYAVRASDAWKATELLECASEYKPILVSTQKVYRCIREWRAVLQCLPIYKEKIAGYSFEALKEYKDTCFAAYQGIVQPHSEDRRICSAAWLKDEDISRFLKSLPNWLNLKAQQEYQARSERSKRALKRGQPSEEECPEDVGIRNRREAEILASNLGEGGIAAGEILSDVTLLKQLAQLQESMEWFSIHMFQYAREFRHEPPSSLSPSRAEPKAPEKNIPISATSLQQLTSVSQEFDELANTCLLLLHLEVRVQCFHYLLAQSHQNKETHEPDPKVLELSRVLANVDEAMTSSLHPRKCKYIFEGLGHLIAKILISSAQYFQSIDEGGIQRMCRNIFTLQQTLTNITMTREVALDHARHYFELFFLTPEEILNGIVESGPQFSELEYMNALQLLHRSRPDRKVPVANHLDRLLEILGGVGVTV